MSSEREPQPVPLGLFVAMAAVGVLLLTFFIARSGSAVAFTLALGLATGLGAIAAALWWRGRRRGHPRGNPAGSPPGSSTRPAPSGTSKPSAELGEEGNKPMASEQIVGVLTHLAITKFEAPASAILVVQGRRLVSAGSAGDWAIARRLMMEAETAGMVHPTSGEDEPPAFPLDPSNDWLERFLGLYHQPVPMERWKELSDVPPPLVPLVGLASNAVGVAVPLTYRRRLYGLWILAQRPGQRHYTDAELAIIERLAQEHGQQLGSTLSRRGR
ncbi:MAG TPA: hypothetical protein VGW38_23135 [Chloroflexota bacterium]|nr:hypothetical protein [Chloroflexota bacterium]